MTAVDPTKLLEEIRTVCREVQRDDCACSRELDFQMAFDKLDVHLSRGGSAPQAWYFVISSFPVGVVRKALLEALDTFKEKLATEIVSRLGKMGRVDDRELDLDDD